MLKAFSGELWATHEMLPALKCSQEGEGESSEERERGEKEKKKSDKMDSFVFYPAVRNKREKGENG